MSTKRILIVEDEQPIREMVVFALANLGYEVREGQPMPARRRN